MGTRPEDVLPLLERPRGRAGYICGMLPTHTSRASGPGNTMASRSWDSMQLEEQAPPNLLPPITPPEPPHLMDPSREVIDQVVGLGARSGAGNLLESRRLRLPCAVCLWRGPWLHPDPPAAAAVDAVATVKPVAPPVAPRAAPAGAYEGALGEAHVAPAAVTGRTCGDGPPRLCQQGWHSRLGLALAAAAEAGGGAGFRIAWVD
eukprot:247626-Pelagomonas_calceolata.AAC.1